MQKDINDFQDEVRLNWHQNFGVEVRLETLHHLVQEARDLSIERRSICLGNHGADEETVWILEESVAERHWMSICYIYAGVCD